MKGRPTGHAYWLSRARIVQGLSAGKTQAGAMTAKTHEWTITMPPELLSMKAADKTDVRMEGLLAWDEYAGKSI